MEVKVLELTGHKVPELPVAKALEVTPAVKAPEREDRVKRREPPAWAKAVEATEPVKAAAEVSRLRTQRPQVQGRAALEPAAPARVAVERVAPVRATQGRVVQVREAEKAVPKITALPELPARKPNSITNYRVRNAPFDEHAGRFHFRQLGT